MTAIDYTKHAQTLIKILKTPSEIQKEGAKEKTKTIGLLNLVCEVESFGLDDYGEPKYYIHRRSEEWASDMYLVDQLTIGKVLDLQRKKKIGAAGAYQFIPGTLEETARFACIDQSELFKADVQDRLALEVIMRKHDLRTYLVTPYGFLPWAREHAAQIWAGLPCKTNEAGESVSYYDGDGVNKANCTVDELDNELIAARQLIQNHFHPEPKAMTKKRDYRALVGGSNFASVFARVVANTQKAVPRDPEAVKHVTEVLARIMKGHYKEGCHPFELELYEKLKHVADRPNQLPVSEAKTRTPADTPYFSQMDNKGGQGWRECFSSSCAMVAAYYGKVESDDEYNEIRRGYGDSTDAQVQVKTLQSLGLIAQMRFDGTHDLLKGELNAGRPVIVGWLHKGPVSWPTGNGHYSVVIDSVTPFGDEDWQGGQWIHHDPYGDADLVNGGYVAVNSPRNQSLGKAIRYSNKNWMPRWDCTPTNRGKGWWMQVMEG